MNKHFRYRNFGLKQLTLCRSVGTTSRGWQVYEGQSTVHKYYAQRGGTLALIDSDEQLLRYAGALSPAAEHPPPRRRAPGAAAGATKRNPMPQLTNHDLMEFERYGYLPALKPTSPPTQMKAITLHQPWATLIMLGYKTYETRSWQTSHRGTMAIHAAMFLSQEYRQLCATDPEISAILTRHGLTYDTLPLGALLGTCQVREMHQTDHMGALSLTELACGDYSPDRWAWTLHSVESLVRPLPCRGFQQLWTVPAEKAVEAITCEALARALTARYGGLVQADDIRDFRRMTEPEEADETLHVQASRDTRTDWYSLTVNSAGQIDYTIIQQLPF
ncbi:hypothetical protein ACVWYF_004163 [Hymenobacter sp. UYAg731]